MAHELDFTSGRAGMAYVGETPWHGLGFALNPGASIEEWQKAAGLDWQVKRATAMYTPQGEDRAPLVAPDRFVLYRDDTDAALSIVSDRYQVVQPGEVLEFYRDLVGAGDFELETAGSLRDGKRIWALARTGDSVRLKGQDQIDGYLLLATSFDGSMATSARFTSVRVVCQNTLSMATTNAAGVRVPHSTKFDASLVKRDLGISRELWAGFSDSLEILADRTIDQKEAIDLMVKTFGDPEIKPEDQKPNVLKQMRAAWDAMLKSPGADLRAATGTAWGFVNGVSYFIDHQRSARTQDARLNRAWFGDGDATKNKAMEAALELAKAA